MRNWINIWSIKSLIKTVADPDNKIKNFSFGQDAEKDIAFLKIMRSKMPADAKNLLGLSTISNKNLLRELNVLNSQIISGTPRIEIEKQCPKCSPPPPIPVPVVEGCPVCPDIPQCPQCPEVPAPQNCEQKVITTNICTDQPTRMVCDQNSCRNICQNFANQIISKYCSK